MAVQKSLQVQLLALFHQCGGNVGDTCDLPIPSCVHQQDGVWFKDREGHQNRECIFFFADDVMCEDCRTPVVMYGDWMQAISATYGAYLGRAVSAIQDGLGASEELQYPAYPLKHWNYPGMGEFQVCDDRARAGRRLADQARGLPAVPSDVGGNSSAPSQSDFYMGGYVGDYGKFFLDWHFGALKSHGS